MLDSTLKKGGKVLNRVASTDNLRATTIVYIHVYPISLPTVGISRRIARCLHIFDTPLCRQHNIRHYCLVLHID